MSDWTWVLVTALVLQKENLFKMSSSKMKYLINKKEYIVVECIEGTVEMHSHLAVLDGFPQTRVVVDRDRYLERARRGQAQQDCVSLVCGGGSGHEPAFVGFVGKGGLTAAVCGDVFASPSEEAVLSALRHVTTDKGCLVLVMNYTGDKLHFGAAVERMRVETSYDVRTVYVQDDVALRHPVEGEGVKKTGARGLAGFVFVVKCAGALAAMGASLDDVERMASAVSAGITTMGCSVSSCNLPGATSERHLGENELEMGLGAHGEPGAYREEMRPVQDIVNSLVEHVGCVGNFEDEQKVNPGDRIAVLLNNMGNVTNIEMGVIAHATQVAIRKVLGATIVRMYSGVILSSLDMKGFSISILRIPDGEKGDEIISLLDAPTKAFAWPSSSVTAMDKDTNAKCIPLPKAPDEATFGGQDRPREEGVDTILNCLTAACHTLISEASRLDELDQVVGDGDCGSTFSTGAAAILDSSAIQNAKSLEELAFLIGTIAGEHMGGSSGALVKIFFNSFARSIQTARRGGLAIDATMVGNALQAGCDKMSQYGGAVKGDRTMLDALIPLAAAVKSSASKSKTDIYKDAAEAARQGANGTSGLVAKAGRSSYVPDSQQRGVIDPGAEAVALVLEAISNSQ